MRQRIRSARLAHGLLVTIRSFQPLPPLRSPVLTVSPKRQNRGMRVPTTPLTTGPEWMPTRTRTESPVVGSDTEEAACSMA